MGRVFLAAVSVAFLCFAVARPAMAQSGAEFSDAELKSFATAAARVQRINDEYLPKLRTARNDDEQRRVQETATAEMRRALEEEGLSVDKFRTIVWQAKSDPALVERIREQFRQSREQ